MLRAAWSTGALLASDAEAHVREDLQALDGDDGLTAIAGSVGSVGQPPAGSVDLFEYAQDRGGVRRLQVLVRMRRGLFDRPQLGEAGVAFVFQALPSFVPGELRGATQIGGG